MNTAAPESGSVLEYEIVPNGLAEFDLEVDRVDPLLAVAPAPAAPRSPIRRDTVHLSSVDRSSFRSSWSPAALLAVAATLAVSGGSWLAVYRPQQSPALAGPTGAAVRQEVPLRPSTGEVPSPVPPQPQPEPPRIERTAPLGGTDRLAPAAVDQALEAYRRSYNTLDAASVSAVWPQADTQALEQLFSTLRYQALSFERCDARLTGPNRAVASCEASISSVPKSGDPTVQRRRVPWRIALERVDDRWLIASVEEHEH